LFIERVAYAARFFCPCEQEHAYFFCPCEQEHAYNDGMSDQGEKIIRSLKRLKSSLEKGKLIDDSYRVSKLRSIVNKKTGEKIYSRIEKK